MKKVVALILLFSFNTAAAEVVKFDPRPAVVEQEGSTYIGILLSEEDFRKILQKKIDTNAKIADCQVDQRVCKRIIHGLKEIVEPWVWLQAWWSEPECLLVLSTQYTKNE